MRILTLSRLTIQKRVDRLIEAVGLLPFPVELVIIGDGEDRDKLEGLAESKAPGRVRFTGHLTHKEVPAHHAWADLFVIPSDREGGMPLNVLEAMAAGLPIVGSSADGVRELLKGVGIVVEDPSAETFAAALRALQGDPEQLKTLSEQSSATAAAYTWPKAFHTIEEVYTLIRRQRAVSVVEQSA